MFSKSRDSKLKATKRCKQNDGRERRLSSTVLYYKREAATEFTTKKYTK